MLQVSMGSVVKAALERCSEEYCIADSMPTGTLDQVLYFVVQERHQICGSWNLTGRISSPTRSHMLYPKINQSILFILGYRKSFKNKFLNFLRLIFQSFRYVIKFEKHLIWFILQKSQNSGFGGLGELLNCSLATEKPSFRYLKN